MFTGSLKKNKSPKKTHPKLLWEWNKTENEMMELNLMLFRVAPCLLSGLSKPWSYPSLFMLNNVLLKTWRVCKLVLSHKCLLGKENRCTLESQPWSLA